ncbi:hypothetical protein [Pinibacter soli]|uniref:Uncharacterized protein n=1 Tax=Pinibacter soli TaxID=3044211 RepID=A0ABT6REM2_9BACT|nr:hypothetical protein [Pinibacter soli]MDI3321026.1 hypothetical protein [Pinibacter soli]
MKTILVITSLFLSSIAFCQQHKKAKSIDAAYYGLDTICKIVKGDFSDIADRLESRLQAAHLKDSSLFNLKDSAATNISYFRYCGPTGEYLLVKICVDSSGKFRSYDVSHNTVKDKKYDKRAVKVLNAMQSFDYSPIMKKRGVLRTSCYITDATDVFLIVNNKSGVLNGLGVVSLGSNDRLGADYAFLLMICGGII